jgi:hypothetical protein
MVQNLFQLTYRFLALGKNAEDHQPAFVRERL